MNTKRILIKIILMIILFAILFPVENKVHARMITNYEMADNGYNGRDTANTDNGLNTGDFKPKIGSGDQKIAAIGNIVVKVIKIVGSALSVIALAVIGVKYIYGSIEQKAQYKETLMPYIIGAILVFGASNVVGILYRLAF